MLPVVDCQRNQLPRHLIPMYMCVRVYICVDIVIVLAYAPYSHKLAVTSTHTSEYTTPFSHSVLIRNLTERLLTKTQIIFSANNVRDRRHSGGHPHRRLRCHPEYDAAIILAKHTSVVTAVIYRSLIYT